MGESVSYLFRLLEADSIPWFMATSLQSFNLFLLCSTRPRVCAYVCMCVGVQMCVKSTASLL